MATAINVTGFGKCVEFTHPVLFIQRSLEPYNITQQKCVGLKGSDKPPFKPGLKVAGYAPAQILNFNE